MTYALRMRTDGQAEIVRNVPTLVAVVPEWAVAERLLKILQAEEAESDVGEAPVETATVAAPKTDIEPFPLKPKVFTSRPTFETGHISDQNLRLAFLRIEGGELLGDVAKALDIPLGTLRGQWANRCRHSQTKAGQEQNVVAPQNLPAIVPQGKSVAIRKSSTIAAEVLAVAFEALERGETVTEVAATMGLNFYVLRGHWGHFVKQRQHRLAEGGQQPCVGCKTMFTPSLSQPEHCARCAHV